MVTRIETKKPDRLFIAEWRKHRGMTQDDLAERVGAKNKGTVSRWESGDRDLTRKALAAIAHALKCGEEDLRHAPPGKFSPIALPHNNSVKSAPPTAPAMPFLNKGDGYQVDPSRATGATKAFFDQHMGENRQAWHLTSDVLDAGECKPGSYLVVELGTQPEPNTVVLAVTADNVPVFRLWVGGTLIAAPVVPSDTPPLIEGRDARVLGVVVACRTPGR